jgi:hypothetical protein
VPKAEPYPYIEARNAQGETLPRPLLPLALKNDTQSLRLHGLLDTGATVNVLPHEVGLELGLEWVEQRRSIKLTGNLAQYEARGVILSGSIGQFEPVPLIFAWTRRRCAALARSGQIFSQSSTSASSMHRVYLRYNLNRERLLRVNRPLAQPRPRYAHPAPVARR